MSLPTCAPVAIEMRQELENAMTYVNQQTTLHDIKLRSGMLFFIAQHEIANKLDAFVVMLGLTVGGIQCVLRVVCLLRGLTCIAQAPKRLQMRFVAAQSVFITLFTIA